MTIENENFCHEISILMSASNYCEFKAAIFDVFDVNKTYKDGKTLLHRAAELNDDNFIEIISSHPKLDLNAKNSADSWTPVITAASFGSSKALKILLDKGADATGQNSNKFSALMAASKANRMECIEIILEADIKLVKLQDENGMNALMHGIQHPLIVEKLIMYSDLTQVDNKGKTALHMASDKNLDSVKLILDQKMLDINAKDGDGRNPLDCAAAMGNIDIINFLVDNDAILDISRWNCKIFYPALIEKDESETFLLKHMFNDPIPYYFIELLVDFNRQKILKAYAEAYLNADCTDKLNRFIEIAIRRVLNYEFDRSDCLKLLLPYLKSIENLSNWLLYSTYYSKNFKYFEIGFRHFSSMYSKVELEQLIDELFQKAIDENSVDVCRFLLLNGANPNLVGDSCPLIVGSRCQDIVELLIEYGADVNIICKHRKKTPLEYASYYDKINFIKTLLKHGADPYKYDSVGCTPIMEAIESSKLEILLIFLSLNDKFKTFKIEVGEYKGMTHFLYACHLSGLNTIKALIKNGACLDDVDSKNQNCLHIFLNRDYRLEWFLNLENASEDKLVHLFTAKDDSGTSPLDILSQRNEKIMLKKIAIAYPELREHIKMPINIVMTIEEQEMCLICRDQFIEGEFATKLPCRHLYHKNCINQFQSSRCPYCQLDFIRL